MSNNKKLLFVGLRYQDYTSAIIKEMELAGYSVTYIDIQPRTLFFKIFKTLSLLLYNKYLELYHRRAIVAAAGTEYNLVVFLQAHQITLDNLRYLKKTQPGARFVLYNWDSLSNHDYRPQAPCFDRIYTFDRVDAEKYGFSYLPLFCIRSMQGLNKGRVQPHTVYMVGNIVNVKRYEAVMKFMDYCNEHGLCFRTYLVISPVVYFRMLRQGIIPRNVYFRSIDIRRFHDMIETSSAVFDFANHQQSGYTMRTIENLCAGKKIVTNNKYVLNDFFYSPDRVLHFDEFDYSRVAEFLNIELADPDREFEELNIQSFVRNLLHDPSAELGYNIQHQICYE